MGMEGNGEDRIGRDRQGRGCNQALHHIVNMHGKEK